ncbi:MAG: hypothetical protein MUC92_11485 [Fimbriimonadaceae bacterium]|jgi:hypothetical protein|nr:hypothetical protein [Fimbriimonadaceae bacterium]
MLLGLLVQALGSDLFLSYVSQRGISFRANDLPIIRGSSFQYYEKGWTRGYYSAYWNPVDVKTSQDGTITVEYKGNNGQVEGTLVFRRTPTGFIGDYEFRWNGDQPAMVEASLAEFWAAPIVNGSYSIGGGSARKVGAAPAPGTPFEQRILATGENWEFDTPAATVSVKVTGAQPVLMDARNYDLDWSRNKEALWLGIQGAEVAKGKPFRMTAEWIVTPKSLQPLPSRTVATTQLRTNRAEVANTTPLPLFPKPKEAKLTGGGSWAVNAGFRVQGAFSQEVAPTLAAINRLKDQLWDPITPQDYTFSRPTLIRLEQGGSFPSKEGYEITINRSGVRLRAQTVAGMRHGLWTLAILARPEEGNLVLPYAEIRDWPSLSWRGVHMFVGPEALRFQTVLNERMMALSKFNNVVLQCERTDWLATPGIRTSQTMTRGDLASLFAQYRRHGMEPIPLIQSLGHMGWLFANNQNRDLAENQAEPFAVNPDVPRTRTLLRDLWKEAVTLLRPSTIHFGLDEIDMRGHRGGHDRATAMLRTHVPWLLDLADELKVERMVWSDMFLHSSEAPDATNAPSVAVAQERRGFLRPGTIIADWHYKNDPNPDIYKSLRVWKEAGMQPIGSHWYRENNIRGQTLAAVREGAGVLQTTWAGYESNEFNFVREFDQFSAYLLAGDYAWSGRSELPKDLDYNPHLLLRRLYFGEPSSLVNRAGRFVNIASRGEETQVGRILFRLGDPITLFGRAHPKSVNQPRDVTVSITGAASKVDLALDTLVWVDDLTDVATLEVVTDKGTIRQAIRYGEHVRGATDSRQTIRTIRDRGLSVVRVLLPRNASLRQINLTATDPMAGIRLHGITTQ